MAYSAEVLKRARARLAQDKEDRDSENRQHMAEAYARVPRIREIDTQLRVNMAKAVQTAFSKGMDVQQAMDQIREQNRILQQERARLAAEYFPEGYLDDKPICEICGGTGYLGSNMCRCLKKYCQEEQKKELTVLSGGTESFDQFRLDYYPDRIDPNYGASPRTLMELNLRKCRTYAAGFGPESGNLLFVGGTGLGKTFLSACISQVVTDRGYSVHYEPATHLFTKLEQAKFSPNEENRREAAQIGDCDLLIVDDLGTEMPGQFVTAALYSLLNDRMIERKPILISTNMSED